MPYFFLSEYPNLIGMRSLRLIHSMTIKNLISIFHYQNIENIVVKQALQYSILFNLICFFQIPVKEMFYFTPKEASNRDA
ncbi:hypothetical protein BpHYR1_048361 [Brachionus plicatilis]|uniref:Uncharacterized protein n=1 Tax=Brachionus plicatilis TaxID=10195 RepID=A0A3M7QLL2_BRAPC|nr:hypothetical protein BpHYR1_048361 [Brachionus plicatilis]